MTNNSNKNCHNKVNKNNVENKKINLADNISKLIIRIKLLKTNKDFVSI